MTDQNNSDCLNGQADLEGGVTHLESRQLKYLAEGNANVVYAFEPKEGEIIRRDLRRKLLRLRKDKNFIEPTESQIATYRQYFVPLFRPENLVEQVLIPVDQTIIKALNEDLEQKEHSGMREKLRHGDRLATGDFALLMTDMTPQPGEYLFEIKPKWLQQSPDAPQGSIRCRTCALRSQRNAAKAKGDVIPNPGGFCPLSLVDADLEERRRAFKEIVQSQARDIPQRAVESIVQFLAEKGYRVLLDLRKYQTQFDKHGLLSSESEKIPDEYSKAMTLRDCLLFVRGSLDRFPDTAEARLADLDFKHAHPDKVEKWKSTERKLVDQGWYTNTGADSGYEPICLLTRKSRESISP